METNKLRESSETPITENNDFKELAERLVDGKGSDQEISEVLARNWQKFAGLLVVVLMCVWVYGEFKTAKIKKYEEASDSFFAINAELTKLKEPSISKEDKTKAETIIKEQIANLEEGFSDSTYGKVADSYLASFYYDQNNNKEALNAVSGVKDTVFPAQKINSDRFVEELAVLQKTKLLLTGDKKSQEEAQSKLKSIVSNANFTNVEALIALKKLAQSEKDKKAVEELANKLRTEKPQFAELIEAEFPEI